MTKQIIKNMSCLLGILLLVAEAGAQPACRTQELQRLFVTTKVDSKTLREGYNYPSANGAELVVRVKDNAVDHIGLKLFSADVRELDKTPVFDFLERYFLQLKYPPTVKTAQNMIRDDQFQFLKGSMQTIDKLLPTDEFSYQYDRHRYSATWQRNGETLLAVSFPVEYELISGENKIEAENHIAYDIQKTTERKGFGNYQNISDGHYISSDYSNRLYYKDGKLLISTDHPAESAANLMLCTDASAEHRLHITQVSYGFKKTVFDVPLKQWIAFCENNGCQLYFGIEDFEEAECVHAVVIAVNQTENYNHVMTVKIPTEAITLPNATIEARLYPYVPTHNVQNLFSSYRKSNPKTYVSR